MTHETAAPLLPRILLWFFLNLALLAAGFILLVRSQFVFDRDFLLTAGAVEHLQTIGDEIATEMSNRPLEQWKDLLDRMKTATRFASMFFQRMADLWSTNRSTCLRSP